MPAKDVPVYLSEIIDVLGPLKDTELWGVLCQSSEALQDIILKGEAVTEEGPTYLINPNTVILCPNGQISFMKRNKPYTLVKYEAPEYHYNMLVSDAAVEKMYIYSLGRTLAAASDLGMNKEQGSTVGRAMETIINAMCDKDPSKRIGLVHVLEACALHAQKHTHRKPYAHSVSQLYKVMIGIPNKVENMNDSTYGSDQSRQNTLRSRERRSRQKNKHRYFRDRHGPMQRSRTRSRSHSRSRSRSRSRGTTDSGYQPDYERRYRRHSGKGYPPYRAESDHHYHHQNGHYPLSNNHQSFNSHPFSHHSRQLSSDFSDGRSYHLSDITFSSAYNGSGTLKSVQSSQHGSMTSLQSNNPAYDKYLRLKERQRKLRVLRHGLHGDGGADAPITLSEAGDCMSDTRSLASLMSYQQGSFTPGLQIGTDMGLRLGRDTDKDQESIISSEVSAIPHEPNALRASKDSGTQVYTQEFDAMPVIKPKESSKSSKPRKEFYGPEFVHKSAKPILQLPIPLQGDSLKNPSHARRVLIVLLTGQKIEAICDPGMTGQQLFEAVITSLGLAEFYYFGLAYVSDGEYFFLDPQTKLNKVAPEGWREGAKAGMPTVTFTVHLRVKFYVQGLNLLRHESTKHLLYLQLRRDMLEERTLCSESKALAGLALQVEYGDYDEESMGKNYLLLEQYFSQMIIRKVGASKLRENIVKFHKEHSGLEQACAEEEFIKLSMDLPEYGIHFYKLLQNKKDTSSNIWIGISLNCLVFGENRSGQRIIVHQHQWHQTQKISFNKRRFSIQEKPILGHGKPIKMNYFTSSYRKGKYLLQFCTAQHSFLMKMKALPSIPGFQDTIHEEDGLCDGDDEMEEGVDSMHADTISDQVSQFADEDENVLILGAEEQIPYRDPPPYNLTLDKDVGYSSDNEAVPNSPQSFGVAEMVLNTKGSTNIQGTHEQQTNEHVETVHENNEAYVLGTSILSQDQPSSSPHNESLNKTLQHRFNHHLLSPELLEHDIFEVILVKEPEFGIGITIVGGENAEKVDLGIYVKSVTPGGPAHRNGKIKPGDRLLAINDHLMEGLQHQTAVQHIRDSPTEVTLLISQVIPPGSVKRRDYDANAEFSAPAVSSLHERNNSSVNNHSKSSIYVDNKVYVPKINLDDIHGDESDDSLTTSRQNIPNSSVRDHCTSDWTDEDLDTERHSKSDVSDIMLDSKNSARNVVSKEYDVLSDDSEFTIDSKPEDFGKEKLEFDLRLMGHNLQEYKVVLNKSGESLGIVITGGTDSSVKDGAICVKSLIPGGVAERSGHLKKGDRILDINDESLNNVTHSQAVDILKNAPQMCVLRIERRLMKKLSSISDPIYAASLESASFDLTPEDIDTGQLKLVDYSLDSFHDASTLYERTVDLEQSDKEEDEESTENSVKETGDMDHLIYPFVTEDNVYETTITKGDCGLGFSVTGGSNKLLPPCIKKIEKEGPADNSELKPRDVILSVNSIPLKGKTHLEVMTTLRSVEGKVTLLMCRPDTKALPYIQNQEVKENYSDVHGNDSETKKQPGDKIVDDSADEIITHSNYQLNASLTEMALPEDHITTPLLDSVHYDSDECPEIRELMAPPSAFATPRTDEESINLDSTKSELERIHKTRLKRISHSDHKDLDSLGTDIRTDSDGAWLCSSLDDMSSKESAVKAPSLVWQADVALPEIPAGDNTEIESDFDDDNDDIICPGLDDCSERTSSDGNLVSNDKLTDVDSVDSPTRTESPKMESNLPYVLTSVPKISKSSPVLKRGILKPGEIEVTLNKRDEGGLGFTVAGGADTTGGCYIKGIMKDPALSDGRLRPGDKLIKVNGEDMTQMDNFEAVKFLKETAKAVTIIVFRDPELWDSPSYSDKSDTLKDLNGHRKSPQIAVTQDTPQIVVTDSDKSHERQDTESAEENLAVDVIEALRQHTTFNQLRDDHVYTPRGMKVSLSPIVSEVESESSFDDGSSSSESQIIKITLDKSACGRLGFSLVTAEIDDQTGVFVKTIRKDGAAAHDGQLKIGDKVLQVNGMSLIGMDQSKAVAVLRKLEGNVHLTISRTYSPNRGIWRLISPTGEIRNIQTSQERLVDQSHPSSLLCDSTLNSDTLEDIANLTDVCLKYDETSQLENKCSVHDEDSARGLSKTNNSHLFRQLSISVPNIIDCDWLEELPLVDIQSGTDQNLLSTLKSLQLKLENDEPLEEFTKLRKVKASDQCEIAQLTDNKAKNRYRNVLPYDFNRVVLSSANNYINASHITIPVKKQIGHYIACQGPLPSTTDDFWKMVWEQKVNVIAMMTLDMEVSKVKCHHYWPVSTDCPYVTEDGVFQVTKMKMQSLENFDVNYLLLENCVLGEERHVIHLNYTTWPDHGVPDSSLPLLQFLQLMHCVHKSGPIVVHCSAGIGRSGTVIALDIALGCIEQNVKMDLYEIIVALRKQRKGMITTKDQYLFCYSSCIEVLEAILE